MKVDGSIGSLIQGVSQQPARERLPGQCSLQENFSSDPVDGLKRRGPLVWIDELLNSGSNYRFTDYDGGSLGRFIIAHTTGDIKVFDLEGNPYTMVLSSGTSYLTDTELKFSGADQKIYIANPDITTAMVSGAHPFIQDGNIIFLLGGQYGRVYTVKLIWKNAAGTETTQSYSITTPNGSSAAQILDLSTTVIAKALLNGPAGGSAITGTAGGLNANATITALFDLAIADDVIYIKKKPAADVVTYNAYVEDGDGGTNAFAVNNSVKDVGGLPRYGPQGYIVTVAGSNASEDNFYLQFTIPVDANGVATALGAGFGREGKWVECVGPNIDYQIDEATMPHVLEKTGPNEFTYSIGAWEDRRAGDDETNALPSFIGHTITDIGAFQGRLAFLSDVNCIMSRTDKHLDFFNQSATGLEDDDPIDVASALGTFVLRSLVPHNRDLVIFADTAQFIIFGRVSLTPKNTSLVLTTKFETDLRAEPVSAGKNVIFAFKYGKFTGLQEFFTDPQGDANNARPITQHVLQYVTGTPLQLISTTNFNKIVVRTSTDMKTAFVYEYVWLGDQKAQSSWSTWKFPRDVIYAFFVDNLLYAVTKEGSSYALYTLDLDDTPDEGITYRVLLDEKILATGVTTTFVLPYAIDDIANYVAVQGDDCPNPGLRAPIASYNAGTKTVTLTRTMAGGDVYFGKRFLSRYIPTPPQVKDRDNVKIDGGMLTIKQYTVFFQNTGYMKAIVTDKYGYMAVVEYSGRVIGAPNNLVGIAAVSDGSYAVSFKKNPDKADIEVQSDSHLPLQLNEIGWEGQWKKKGKRITGNIGA